MFRKVEVNLVVSWNMIVSFIFFLTLIIETYRGRDVRKAVAKMHMNEAKAAHTPGLSGAQKKKLKTQVRIILPVS